jgi:uncharacterized protein (TIGR02996 family)
MARRIVAPPPPPATPDRIASLEAAIVADPDDTDSYLVLADALIEAGDPRGELILAQHQGIAKRDRELTERFGGEISTLAGVPVQLEWRLGFVWRCSVDLRSALDEPVGQLGSALGHPCMQLLHGLVVRCAMHRGPDVIAAIGARTHANLRALALEEELGDWDDGNVDRETAALWPQLPNLESLRLRSERALFDRIEHSRVRRMWLEVAPFAERFKWNLPALESLDWDPHIESECDTSALDALWIQKLPALRDVSLRGYFAGRGILANPDAIQFLRGVHQLTAPGALLVEDRDELFGELLRHAPDLAHLSRLVVTHVRGELPDDLAAALPNLEVQAGSSSL